jgi:hypothetical protein
MTDIQRTSTIKIVWGDGEHTFRLPYDQLVEHGEKLNRGPMAVLRRMDEGEWEPAEIYQTIRLGLIGGGMAPVAALSLAKRYCLDRPLAESLPAAVACLSAALFGVPEAATAQTASATEEPAVG